MSVPALARGGEPKNSLVVQAGYNSTVYNKMNSGFESGPHNDLYSMYERRFEHCKSPKALALSCFHHFGKVFSVGVYAAYCKASGDYYDPADDRVLYVKKTTGLYLMPQLRYSYLDGEVIRIYSGGGLGVGREWSKYDGDAKPGNTKLAWSIVPVGACLAVGRLSLETECEVGTVMSGIKIGIGYNF